MRRRRLAPIRLLALGLLALAAPAAAIPTLREPTGGDLPDAARAALHAALTEEVSLFGGRVLAPRPAAEAQARLQQVAATYPQVAAVQRSLAQVALAAGDVAAAERAFQQAVTLSGGAPWALDDLARFYAARADVVRQVATLEREAATLRAAVRRPGGQAQRDELRRVYERIIAALEVKRVANPDRYRRALVDLFPDDSGALRRYLGELQGRHDEAALRRAALHYLPRRPDDAAYLAKVLADLAEARRDVDGAIAVYTRLLARDPVPPAAPRLYGDYLDLLDRSLRLRPLRRQLELKSRQGPLHGGELATLVLLLRRDGKAAAARALLQTARSEGGSVSAAELRARARLAAAVEAPELQVAFLYAAARGATGALRVTVLGELGEVLCATERRSPLTPRAPLAAFDLAKLDSGPSLVGGLASLLFMNGHGAPDELARTQAALGNGQRALAILAELRRVAPRSAATRELLVRAVQFHRGYRLHAEAAALGEELLRRFPTAPEAVEVGLLTADSYAQAGRAAVADRLYRRLLDRAQRRGADGVHRRVLEAWIAALQAQHRDLEGVKVYAAEVKRRPGDLALLDRFLTYLERRNLYDDQARVYQEAARRLADGGFYARVARFYLRQRRVADFRALSERLVRSLDDQQLLRYLEQTGYLGISGSDRERSSFSRQRDALYRALYRQALDRFPLEPRFIDRVLGSYNRRIPAEAAERDRLVLRYAVLDPGRADAFVRARAGKGRLDGDLAELQAGRNPAARILAVRALVNRSRFVEALAAARRLLADFPGDREVVKQVADLEQSLARPDAATAARAAVKTLDRYLALAPADEALQTRAGDVLAEAGLIAEAQARYETIVALRPADRAAHLRLATVYWDYYLFDRAAATIERVRRLARDPDLYAAKLAAVYESAKRRRAAIREYVRISWSSLDRTLGAGALTRRGAGEEGEEDAEADEEAEEEGADEPAAAVAPQSPRAEAVTPRLLYLARRHHLGAVVDQSFRAAMKAARRDPRPHVAYARYLEAGGRRAAAIQTWLEAVATFRDRFLLERAVAEGRTLGVPGSAVVIAARRRLAELAGGAPDQVQALAAALEQAGQIDAAATELRTLADRLRAGAALEPGEIAAAENRLADLYQGARRPAEALAARARAVAALPPHPVGQAGPREELELRYAVELATAGQGAEAARRFAALQAHLPGDPRPTVAAATARWHRGERAAAVADLQGALAQARQVPAALRRGFVQGLRLALIPRLKELGRRTEVVDQQIELINREPTRRDLVDSVYTYARSHGHLDGRLLDYYGKTAARSPKDHRWPVIRAWIYERRGQPLAAAREYARALEIAPGRVDLTQGQAHAWAAAGRWVEAAGAYRRLYALTDHDRNYLARAAEMLGRAGRHDEARAVVRELVRGSDRPQDYADAAQLLERLGLLRDAQGYAESALTVLLEWPRQRSFDGEAARTYARLAVRVGKTGAAYGRLLAAARQVRADSQRKGNTQAWHERSVADGLTRIHDVLLPQAVAEYGVVADQQALRQALLQRVAGATTWELLGTLPRAAQAAGLPDLERELYERGLSRAEQRDRFVRSLWSLLVGRRDFTAAAAFLASDASGGRGAFTALERAARLAEARRQIGDAAGELGALRQYLAAVAADGERHHRGPFATWNPLVERYLELLRRGQHRAELQKVAATRCSASAQIADFFLRAGERDLMLTALAAVAQGRPPVWLDVKRALALASLGETGSEVRQPLRRALGVRPIGEKVGHRPDLTRELVSSRQLRGMARYGELFHGVEDRATVRRFLEALIEQRPRDAAAYTELGDRLLALREAALAEDAFRRALTLTPGARSLIDRQAQAILAGGDRRRALAVWHRILERRGASLDDHRFHAQALARAGLVAEARGVFAPYLATQAPRLRDDVLVGSLATLRKWYDDAGAGSAWDRYLAALVLSGQRIEVLAAVAGVGRPEGRGLVDPGAAGPYLARGLQLLATSTDATRRWQWQLRHLEWLAAAGRQAEVTATVARLVPTTPPGSRERAQLYLVAEAAAIRGADARGAAARLVALARGGEGPTLLAAALPRFRAAQQELAAATVAAALHRLHLDAGREDRGTLLGLAAALLRLGRAEEALVHLGLLVVREADDPVGLEAVATLLEEHGRFADARGVRLLVTGLRADDAAARVRLARDELRAGLAAAGTDRLLGILVERGASRAARAAAGRALAEAVQGDGRAAARLAARLDPGRGTPAQVVAYARLRQVVERGDEQARVALQRVVQSTPAPGPALLLLGDIELARGRYLAAAHHLERGAVYAGAAGTTRRALFWARRGAGRLDAALLALEDDTTREVLAGLPALLLRDAPLAGLAARAAQALAADGGDVALLAPAAVEVARRAGDDARALYYALAWEHAVAGQPAAGRAGAARTELAARLKRVGELARARHLSESLDDLGRGPLRARLPMTPNAGAAAAPRGTR